MVHKISPSAISRSIISQPPRPPRAVDRNVLRAASTAASITLKLKRPMRLSPNRGASCSQDRRHRHGRPDCDLRIIPSHVPRVRPTAVRIQSNTSSRLVAIGAASSRTRNRIVPRADAGRLAEPVVAADVVSRQNRGIARPHQDEVAVWIDCVLIAREALSCEKTTVAGRWSRIVSTCSHRRPTVASTRVCPPQESVHRLAAVATESAHRLAAVPTESAHRLGAVATVSVHRFGVLATALTTGRFAATATSSGRRLLRFSLLALRSTSIWLFAADQRLTL